MLDISADPQGIALGQVGVKALDHGASALGGQAPQPGVGIAEVTQALLEGRP